MITLFRPAVDPEYYTYVVLRNLGNGELLQRYSASSPGSRGPLGGR